MSRTTRSRNVGLRRTAALTAALAAVFALAGVPATTMATPEPPPVDAAAEPGNVLYSPDLGQHPNGTAGYPRAIRLDHDQSADQSMLATFARGGTGSPTSLPVYRSTNGGTSWAPVSTITSNTPGWDLEAPALYEIPRSIPGLAAGDILAAGTAWRVGDYSIQKVEVFRSTDRGSTWQYLSTCTQTAGQPDTWGHGIWEPVFMVTEDDRLACFISDERPANTPTNNQVIGHYTSSDGGRT